MYFKMEVPCANQTQVKINCNQIFQNEMEGHLTKYIKHALQQT